MIQTVEAVIDEQGKVQLLQNVRLPQVRRALVTILEEKTTSTVSETALLSQASLAEDWNRPEEDEAWSHLQMEQWFWCASHFLIYRIQNCARQLFWLMLEVATGFYVK